MGIFQVIRNIFESFISLIGNLIILFGYVVSTIFFSILLYLIIIRPIWGSLFSKGKRLYWLSILLLLTYGFFVGPIIFIKLADEYGTPGIVSGLIVYLLGIYLISYPGRKVEQAKNSDSESSSQ